MSTDPLPYRLDIIRRAERQIDRISGRDYNKLSAAILALPANPRPHGVLQLRGDRDRYRFRWGNWRILYEIDDDARVVTVTDVLRRNEATYRDI